MFLRLSAEVFFFITFFNYKEEFVMKKFAYLDKVGIMHIVEKMETAVEFCKKGKVVATEIKSAHGFPLDKEGRGVIVYGPEEMKLEADEKNITPIPELAALYKQCM